MRRFLIIISVLWMGLSSAWAGDYGDAVAKWSSYEDVADWLSANYTFDKARQKVIQGRLRAQGPPGLLVRRAETTFTDKQGYCGDAAHFAIDALNRIDPSHQARWVFVKNALGPPHHWVAGFKVDGKLFIMDYGAGHGWRAMNGTHGPYDSLSQYEDFLSGLNMRGFRVEGVRWRDMPGQED